MSKGIGGLPSWALLVIFGGAALVLLSEGLLDSTYDFMGWTVRTVDAAGGVIFLGLVVVGLAMLMWAIGQVGRLG